MRSFWAYNEIFWTFLSEWIRLLVWHMAKFGFWDISAKTWWKSKKNFFFNSSLKGLQGKVEKLQKISINFFFFRKKFFFLENTENRIFCKKIKTKPFFQKNSLLVFFKVQCGHFEPITRSCGHSYPNE